MKRYIFWDIIACSSLKVNRCFGGICRLHLKGWRIVQARNQYEAGSYLLTFNGLHDVIFQKTEVFKTTAVRTSNPTIKNGPKVAVACLSEAKNFYSEILYFSENFFCRQMCYAFETSEDILVDTFSSDGEAS
jgi:hypothetical protein